MRTILILLALVFAAPLCAQRLNDKELLAKLDDASASEARWILTARVFATEGVGIAYEELRPGLAYKRLLKEGDADTFELLTRSDNDVAACFGIAGLQKLAPKRLATLLRKLILRRTPVTTRGGCFGGTTCVAAKTLETFAETPIGAAVLVSAWQRLLNELPTAGASRADPEIAATLKKLLKDKFDFRNAPGVEPYINALLADDERSLPAIRTLVAKNADSIAGRLALQYLSGGERPTVETDLKKQIWRRELDDGDSAVDMLIHAEYWDRQAANLSRAFKQGTPATLEPVCLWQSLTERDWDWLEAQFDPRVSEAAARLRANPIASWRVDQDWPRDPRQLAIWTLCCANEASKSERAKIRFLKGLKENFCALPDRWTWPYAYSIEEGLVKLFEIDDILPLALTALKSSEAPVRLRGARLLLVLSGGWGDAAKEVAAKEGMEKVILSLRQQCDHAATQADWEMRSLSVEVAYELDFYADSWLELASESMEMWVTQLAREMVEQPRKMPFSVTNMLWDVDGRASDLLRHIYEGNTEFLPHDELTDRPDDEGGPTATTIRKRMLAALAKLD